MVIGMDSYHDLAKRGLSAAGFVASYDLTLARSDNFFDYTFILYILLL